MIKSFLVSIFAILLFSLGATGAWFYFQLEKDRESEEDGLPVAVAQAESPTGPADPIPKFAPALPAAHRPAGLTPDELFRLRTATESQREQLAQHEDKLREQNQRIVTSNADTKAAQREVEGALQQLQNMSEAAEKLLADVAAAKEELKKESAAVQKKMDDLKAMEEDVGAGAKANIKKISEIMAGMPPVESAGMMVELTNDGKIDFALQLLGNLEPRVASKVLAEIKDGQLRAEMASRFRDMIQLK